MNLKEEQKYPIYLHKIKTFEEKRRLYKNSDLRKRYLEVLECEKELIESLNQRKTLEMYLGLFCQLVTSGALSLNNKFQKKANYIELTLEPGISIISGAGCCRNLSAHFNTIMNLIVQNKSFVLAGTNYINKQYYLNANNEDKKSSSNIRNLLLPNHMESFDINTNTLFDPLNFRIQTFDITSQKEEYFIGLVDLGIDAMINNDIKEEECSRRLLELLNYSSSLTTAKRTFYPSDYLLVLKEQCENICQENTGAIENFKTKVKLKQQYIKNEAEKYQKNNY